MALATGERVRVVAVGDPFVPADIFLAGLRTLEDADCSVVQIDTLYPGPVPQPVRVREYVGTPDDIIAELGDADVLLVHAAPVTAAVLDANSKLRVVGCARGGPVNVDLDAATERGVTVIRAPGRNAGAVAELTILLMIALARNVKPAMHAAESSTVGGSVLEGAQYLGRELGKRTLGVVGCGRVGTRVIELAIAFGMTVLAYDPKVPDEIVAAAGATPLALEKLLHRSDVVSLHARASSQTENMFGAEQFAVMREGALFVNTARETLVDESALLDALDSGAIGGAGLDVIRPRPDGSRSPLLSRSDTVVLPHVGGATREAGLNGVRMLVDAVARMRAGERPTEHIANGHGLASRDGGPRRS